MIGRNDNCWCGSRKKWKQCHYPLQDNMKPFLPALRESYLQQYHILLKTPEQLAGIRSAGHLAAQILEEVCLHAKEGVTTLELNELAYNLHKKANAVPAPLHYGNPPFPKSICTSINEVICHGIPDNRPLQKGDIMNVDVTVLYQGFFGDCSKMVIIGSTTAERQLVVDVAYECLMKSIEILKPGVPINQIGSVIEEHALSRGCSSVHQFVGHGVGIYFHESPQIPHFQNDISIPLAPGMTFTIEPMINAGTQEAVIDSKDKWTARTRDGKASAQWEHTVCITEDHYEILTPWRR